MGGKGPKRSYFGQSPPQELARRRSAQRCVPSSCFYWHTSRHFCCFAVSLIFCVLTFFLKFLGFANQPTMHSKTKTIYIFQFYLLLLLLLSAYAEKFGVSRMRDFLVQYKNLSICQILYIVSLSLLTVRPVISTNLQTSQVYFDMTNSCSLRLFLVQFTKYFFSLRQSCINTADKCPPPYIVLSLPITPPGKKKLSWRRLVS